MVIVGIEPHLSSLDAVQRAQRHSCDIVVFAKKNGRCDFFGFGIHSGDFGQHESGFGFTTAVPFHQVISAVVHSIATALCKNCSGDSGKADFVDIIITDVLQLIADVEGGGIGDNILDGEQL